MAEDIDEGPGRVWIDPGPQLLGQPDAAAFHDATDHGIHLVVAQHVHVRVDIRRNGENERLHASLLRFSEPASLAGPDAPAQLLICLVLTEGLTNISPAGFALTSGLVHLCVICVTK